ncbi:MAG: FAD-dependent oxidoreductase [Actinomycetota bacterium]|nr:FAD-dependent oxidoreductase [Actinomycetota bacterium]MDD5667182.1 FAD-dependent oxidoreductase [Actinomycetota bacterium]
MAEATRQAIDLTLRWPDGAGRTLSKLASPRVDSDRCINCGTCLEVCPTGAIREMQRQICRLCPDCAQGPIMFPEEMLRLASRSCAAACPIGHYPEGYVNMIARGDWEGAWKLVDAVNPLPGVLGRICSRPCEEECKRGALIDRSLPIRAMKREIASWAYEHGMASARAYRRNIDMRVAVVGAGPAGLTAASDLASFGYRVTVFEAGPAPGGMLRLAVPAFRLPDEVWEREFARALSGGIEVVCGACVGTSPSLRELLDDGFKAVVLATGATRGRKLDIPGSGFQGVYNALDFMASVKSGKPLEVGERVVVVGGGSVATDAARTALRKGALEVNMVCIEQEREVPALAWEMEEARREGIGLIAGYAPLRITSSWMKAEAIELARVERICCDDAGRLTTELDDSTTMTLPVDTVVFAVGQAVDAAQLKRMGLETTPAGALRFDPETASTSLPGIFAAGDLVNRQGSVVEAMSSGRTAARSVDAYLSGRSYARKAASPSRAPLEEKIFPVRLEKAEPLRLPHLETREALASFREVDLPPGRERLEEDARRCMRCGYIEVDHDLCLGCGICRETCPAGDVLTMGAPVAGGER